MNSLRLSVFAALFTALIVVGAYLKIPVGPVPIVLANFFVILAGAVLGTRWATASVGLYLLLGVLGLPVFAGGGGIAYLTGPTGGFLLGYLPAAALAGLLTHLRKRNTLIDLLGLVAGALAIYVLGVPWLKYALEMSWPESLAAGMLPFLVGDAIKVAGALVIVGLLRKRLPELFAAFQERSEAE